jgi:hypothetical protein
MVDRHVLFLALGGNRRREITDGSAVVLAGGGQVTVAVDEPAAWQNFDARVRVVALASLESRGLALRVERLLLFRVPARLLRLAQHGPLRSFAARAAGAYDRRFARRVHRRVVLPLYRRLRGDRRVDLLCGQLLGGPPVSALVLTDADSIALVPALRARGAALGAQLAFRIDEVAVPR